jgi:hypothetical protein
MKRNADAQKEDLAIFDRFIEKCPNFAGVPICTRRHSGLNDPPDIICEDALANKIGVELTEGINEDRYAISHGLDKLLQAKPGWYILLTCNDQSYDRAQRAAVRREFDQLISQRIAGAVPVNGVLSFDVGSADIKALAPTMAAYCLRIQGVKKRDGEVGENEVSIARWYSPESHLDPAKMSIEKQLEQKLLKDSYHDLKRQLGLKNLFLVLHYNAEARKGVPVSPELLAASRKVVAKLGARQFDGIFLFADIPVLLGRFMRCDRVYP